MTFSPCTDADAAELGGTGGGAADVGARRAPAQRLFEDLAGETRVVAQCRPRVRVFGERLQSELDREDRGVDSG